MKPSCVFMLCTAQNFYQPNTQLWMIHTDHQHQASCCPQCSGGAVVEHHGLSSPRMEPSTEPTAPQALLAADRQSQLR